MAKQQGTVKFFKAENGYGFIQPKDGSEDVFVHISDLKEAGYTSIEKGNTVEFQKTENRGRIKATDITIIS